MRQNRRTGVLPPRNDLMEELSLGGEGLFGEMAIGEQDSCEGLDGYEISQSLLSGTETVEENSPLGWDIYESLFDNPTFEEAAMQPNSAQGAGSVVDTREIPKPPMFFTDFSTRFGNQLSSTATFESELPLQLFPNPSHMNSVTQNFSKLQTDR